LFLDRWRGGSNKNRKLSKTIALQHSLEVIQLITNKCTLNTGIGVAIHDALSKFTSWYNDIKATYKVDELPIWGNGSSADCGMLFDTSSKYLTIKNPKIKSVDDIGICEMSFGKICYKL
jgi:hypothetical protein